ncbi:MAG: hypothetical protein J6Z01_14215 [Bacteroidales bacterium]|nr:hypothetical protein [Bacteroidales bacterium]
MLSFSRNTKHQKKSGARLFIYGLILFGIIAIFIPKLLISKAYKIIEANITGTTADSLPKNEIFTANNYLLTARYFPGFDQKGADGQKVILDYYFPLFKADYDRLKFACVDNAISELSKQGGDKDSIRSIALESEWKKYPDSAALADFRSKWDIYHKVFIKSLPDYYRFIDAQHIR